MSILRAVASQRHRGGSRNMDDTSTIHGAVGVVIRHIDALAGLVYTYKEHRIESFRDVDYLVQNAEWAVDRHVYPIISALDAMDRFVVEWYRTVLMKKPETKHDDRLKKEISNMTEDEVKNRLSADLKNSDAKLYDFLDANGFLGDTAVQELFNKIEEWRKAFGSSESKAAFEARTEEVRRLMEMDNDEDVDRNLRVVRHMVRLFETKIPLIERFVSRIKKGGVLVTGSLEKETDRKEIKVQETHGGEPELMILGMSLRDWAEFGKYYIRVLEVKKELHDVKCRTKTSDKPDEFQKIIKRELSVLQNQIDRHHGVLSRRIADAESVEDIGKVNAHIKLELMKLNEMIKLVDEYTESVIAPSIIHVYGSKYSRDYASTVADQLKRTVEEVRVHKENVFKTIIRNEITKLRDPRVSLFESLKRRVDETKDFRDLINIRKDLSHLDLRVNELSEVIGDIEDFPNLVFMLDDHRENVYVAGRKEMNDTIDGLRAYTTGMSNDSIRSQVTAKIRSIQKSSIQTSFGRYVHRVAKSSLRVAPRAWSA